MKIQAKLNLLSLGIILVMTIALLSTGTVLINDILFGFQDRMMHLELHNAEKEIIQVLHHSGVRAATDKAAALQSRMQQTKSLQSASLYVVESTGKRVVFHPHLSPGDEVPGVYIQQVFEKGEGAMWYDLDGSRYYTVFTTVRPLNWLIGISVTQAELLEEGVPIFHSSTKIVLAALLLNAFVISLFGARLVRRIAATLACVNRIKNGDLSARIAPMTGQDEIRNLQEGINAMGAQLLHRTKERSQAEAEVRELNVTLEQRVRDRTAQLEAANMELESFSYSVSHDLRAPLRSIDGFSRILQEDYAGKLDSEGYETLQTIRAASQRMGHLIDDMLLLARVTQSELKRTTVDLRAIAAVVISDLRRESPKRSVKVIAAPDLVARADVSLMRILLENLLGNAWKFTARQPEACIEFGRLEGAPEPTFFVRDNGAGFDPAYVHRLFGAFQRLHTANEFPGTGIGLATVQRIIRRHGGKVWAEGKVDQGATFFFTLP